MSKEIKDGSCLPKYGIFGPTQPMKLGVHLEDIKKASDDGTVLEFCTEDLSGNFNDMMLREEKYFDSPDMMKCSYLMEELTSASDEDESVSTFEKLKAKMKNVTPDGGVKKALLSEGVGAVTPADARVRLHYHAYLEDMVEPYDSSYLQGKELRITLGQGHVVPGMDLGIGTMRKREKSRFLVSPEYAYGTMGCPPRIPSEATILFEVELLGFTESSILDECEDNDGVVKDVSFEKMVARAKAEKNEGNDLFQQRQYIKAQQKFMRCINAMESVRLKDEKEEAEMMKIVSKAYQNTALCSLRLGNFGKALAAGRRVLECDPDHPKALYIAGKSLRHIGDFAEARKYMLRARKFAPSSADVTKELRLIDKAEQRFHDAEIGMCQRMFSGATGDIRKRANNNNKTEVNYGTSSAFQSIIKCRLTSFQNDRSVKELAIPVSAFTQHEIYCAAGAAEKMGLQVELIDKPGVEKQLKISKHEN